jgi:hypothetical protein
MVFVNEAGDVEGWSAVFVQDKNRVKGDKNALHNITPSDPTIQLQTEQPFIAICFDFGTEYPPNLQPDMQITTLTTGSGSKLMASINRSFLYLWFNLDLPISSWL